MFEASTFLTTEKSEVSSANNLEFDAKFSDKSMILMKNNSDPRIEPWETLASILAHKEYCPFNMTLWILIDKFFFKYEGGFKLTYPHLPRKKYPQKLQPYLG